MTGMFPYRIEIIMYSGMRYTHFIHARNKEDAFSKAHRFANPLAMSGTDGVQFIVPYRLSAMYCTEYNIRFDDEEGE